MKKLLSLLEKVEYTAKNDLSSLSVDNITNDSRTASDGTVFVAIKGAVFDGHRFAEKAYFNGCRIFVCERDPQLPEDAYIIITPDTRKALALMSAAYYSYPAKRMRIIGITGTKGKTTTAILIYSVLNAAGVRAAYIGSNGIDYACHHYDTANTTPESCELHYHFSKMAEAGIEYVVMEVSSQAIYLHRVYGIEFETVMFTNLAPDHIGGAEHPTFEHYRDCKRSLFYDYKAKNMIYNADDGEASYMVNPALSLYPVSLHGRGGFNADNIEQFARDGVLGISFDFKTSSESFEVITRSPGEFSAYNALCAMVCAKLCGVPFSVSASLLSKISVLGRFECVDITDDRYFIIDYAHNGLSLKSVLTALKAYPHGRLICLFGSVGARTEGRRAELGAVAAELCDYSVITSDNPDTEAPEQIIEQIAEQFSSCEPSAYTKIADREEAIAHAIAYSRPGDIILLAGKGHEKYQLVNGIKIPFCERELLYKHAGALKKAATAN